MTDDTDTDGTDKPKRPGGRLPAGPDGRVRDKQITVLATAEERAAWKAGAAAARVSVSAWARAALNGAPVVRAPRGAPVAPSLARQVAAVGNNCNQVARQLNAAVLAGLLRDATAAVYLDALLDVRDDLRDLAAAAAGRAAADDGKD